MRSLGYPRSRKNGGQSEAGAQPCRFIARRATNGAPPSEAAQPKGESRRRPSTSFALLGYPRNRKNGGHSVFRDRFGFVAVFMMRRNRGRGMFLSELLAICRREMAGVRDAAPGEAEILVSAVTGIPRSRLFLSMDAVSYTHLTLPTQRIV